MIEFDTDYLIVGYGDGKTRAADTIAGNPPFGAALDVDDGYAELEAHWPSLEQEPDGVDILREKYGAPTGEPSDLQAH